MSLTRADVEEFFRTLLLGDIEEQQNTAAQLVGGLISLIPVLGQVMAVRDLSGTLMHINRSGGFKTATPEQVVNFGFAAFGAIPEVGSVFKGVLKPMWKERRAAQGLVRSGSEAIETMLGMSKGGAVRWLKTLDWVAYGRNAASVANSGLSSCIELTEFVSQAQGWKGHLIPDSVQALATEMLPPLRSMQGTLDEPLQRATLEIKAFVEDLLGEHAAAVAVVLAERVTTASAVPGSRSRAGHNAAAPKASKGAKSSHGTHAVPERQVHKQVQSQPRAHTSQGQGPVHATLVTTRKLASNVAAREKGLIGEHVVDYLEMRRLGGHWRHDTDKGRWTPETVRKLNVDRRPVNLSLVDLPKVNQPGIDAVWQHGTNYTVTEAKASESIGAAYGFGKYKVKKGLIPHVTGLSQDHELLHYLLSDSSDKGGAGAPVVQMSIAWVRDRTPREHLPWAAESALLSNKASRRIVLVTFEATGAVDHAEALAGLHLGKKDDELPTHTEHGMTREWDAAAIDAVVEARHAAQKAKQAQPASTAEAERPQKPAKPAKGSKPSK